MYLNTQQEAIVKTSKGKVSVIAGPGSGKTFTLIELIFKLHTVDRIPLENMFITTFTNKAGREIKERLRKRLGLAQDRINHLWIGTFHSLGYRYLTRERYKKYNIILPVEAKYYLRNIYKQVIEEDKEELINFDDILENIEKKRNRCCSWKEVSEYPEICERVYNLYEKEKRTLNLVDFTDILVLFKESIDDNFIKKFKWVLIDECQDLNRLQIDLVDTLSKENTVLVGDPVQSLYSWRGASPELFKEKIKGSDLVFPLEYNYRSSSSILNFANQLIKQYPEYADRKLISTKESGILPSFKVCECQAKEIYRAIKEDIQNKVPLEEIAVLARTIKAANIGDLQVLLRQDKIPYVTRGGDDRLDSVYVQNYLSLLKTLCAPTKISTVNTLSLLPGVGPKTAIKLAEEVQSKNIGVLSSLDSKVSQTKAYKDFVGLTQIKDNQNILLGSLNFLHEHYLKFKYKEEANQKKETIFNLLYDTLMEHKNLAEGIDSLYVNDEDEESDIGKVVISTIHQSKGLEFQSVHIANFNEHSMPYLKEEDEENPKRLEEEFCVAYVAITRAKKYLRMYMDHEGGKANWKKPNKVSRYIKEIFRVYKEKFFSLTVLNSEDIKEQLFYKWNKEILDANKKDEKDTITKKN